MPPTKPRRSPKPQERQRDPERTRKLILDAATAEFAAHGYAGARTAAIAQRAGVNQQLVSYYFDGKQGLYQAISERWREREDELVGRDTLPSEQIRQYAMEALHNPEGVRLLAWGGLEYTGPDSDSDQRRRATRLEQFVDRLRARQDAGQVAADLDPACLTVMLLAAAMATTSLPHVIEGTCQVDPRDPAFVQHYAEQLTLLARHLGLD